MRSGQQLSTRGGGYGVTGYSGGYGGNDPIEQMFQVMEQLSSVLGSSLVGRRGGVLGQGQQGGQQVSYVTLDVTENNEQYQIIAELPGANPQEVEVTVEGDNTLLIRAQKQQQTQQQQQQGNLLIQERQQGTYLRSLTLPQHVDRDNIRANFNNGVLEIVVPKSREHQQQQKRIQIQTGGGTGSGSGSGSGSRT